MDVEIVREHRFRVVKYSDGRYALVLDERVDLATSVDRGEIVRQIAEVLEEELPVEKIWEHRFQAI